jgi:hypothetical protein
MEALRDEQEITLEMRQRIARVRNAIEALRMNFIAIFPGSISDTYDESLRLNIAIKARLQLSVPDSVAG